MVDLKGQFEKIRAQIYQEWEKILETTSFINGTVVKEFAELLSDYLKVKYVIPCGNGTDALQVAMMAAGLKPGDEVITTPFTFIATAEVIALLGLKPVFVDVDEKTFNLDINQLEDAITPRTRAIVPVHLFGQCCDMEAILRIAGQYNLIVIEDDAQAIGSKYHFPDGTVKLSGTMGDIGCTSFFPSKNLGAYGDGGALFTNDDSLAERIKMIVNHGMKKRYYHEIIGVNSRLDSLQAAVLKVKLQYLDSYIENRRKAAAFYDTALAVVKELEIPYRSSYSTHVFHQYTLKVKNNLRDSLHHYLLENKIPNAIYYPVPLHLQKAFQYYGYQKGDFPVSERLSEQVLSLPMHTELDEEQLNFICKTIINFFSNATAPK